MADGRLTVLKIDEILNDKVLFLKYVLGDKCKFCKAFKIERIKDEDIDTIKDSVAKPQNVRDQRLALLRAKMKKINENPDIDLVAEVEKENSLKCDDSNCLKEDYIDNDKLNSKYNEVIEKLKKNVEIWKKKGYEIVGYEGKEYGLKFIKGNQEITYFNKTEQFDKNCTLGALEVYLFSEWIGLVNDELKSFVEQIYK